MRVTLLRHGESTWNEDGRLQGSTDYSKLTPKGIQQARAAEEQLRRVDFDALVHSPLQRASLTADIVWAERPGRRLALWELREVDLYGWQGLTRAAAAARDPAAYAAWQHDPEMLQLDGRWPMRELWLRASGVWRALREEFAAGAGGSDPRGCELADGAGPGEEETGTGRGTTRVLLVAHQGVNKALLATALGLPIAAFRCLPQANSAYSSLAFERDATGPGPVTVHCLNQASLDRLLGAADPRARRVFFWVGPENGASTAALCLELGATPMQAAEGGWEPALRRVLEGLGREAGPSAQHALFVSVDAPEQLASYLHRCVGTDPEAVRWAVAAGTLTLLAFHGADAPVVHCFNLPVSHACDLAC